jgi:hypothetical protein
MLRRLVCWSDGDGVRPVYIELKRRHCLIPQFPHMVAVYERQNVVKGEFARAGQTDWAVLCSTKRTTMVVVFWNGVETNPSELEVRLNSNLSFIGPAGKEMILADHSASERLALPLIEHEGIVLATDTDHTIMYYFDGNWMTLSRVQDRIY